MNWIRVALTVFAGGLAASLTDWLFMGDWLYRRYDQHPEIWRHPRGQGEMKAIAWASLLPLRHLRGLHLLVRPPGLPRLQRHAGTRVRHLASRPVAFAHREYALHQTPPRHYRVLFHRLAREADPGSPGGHLDPALGRRRAAISVRRKNGHAVIGSHRGGQAVIPRHMPVVVEDIPP